VKHVSDANQNPFGIASGGSASQILLKVMRTLTNVVITPHVASRTYESVVRQANCAVKNLILAMSGGKPIAQVNPEVR
jgi:lactate dehydrogenase-like 2-hydroxyacid dehydrogenase